MKHKTWKIELLCAALLLCLAEAGFIPSWAVTPFRVVGILGLIGVALVLPRFFAFLGNLRNGVFWVAVLGLFAISRLSWLIVVPTVQVSDFRYYFEMACHVAQGHGIIDGNLGLYPNWWGYPLVLGLVFWIFGCSVTVGKVFSFFLVAATIPPLYLTANRFGGRPAGRWAVLLFVVWPAQLMFTSVLATEHLALPIAMTGFLFWIKFLLDGDDHRLRNAIVCGIFLGWGGAIRPAVTMMLLAFGVVFLLRIRPWRTVIRGGFALALTYLAVTWAYGLVFQHFNHGEKPTPSFSIAANLLYGSNYQALGAWSMEYLNTINSWTKENALRNSLQITRQRYASYSLDQILFLYWKKNTEFWAQPYYGYLFSTRELAGLPKLAWFTDSLVAESAYAFQIFLVIGCALAAFRFMRGNPFPSLEVAAAVIIFGTAMHLVFVVASRYSYIYTAVLLVFVAASFAKASASDKKQALPEKDPGRSLSTTTGLSGQHVQVMEPGTGSGRGELATGPEFPYEPAPQFRDIIDDPEQTDCRGKRIGILIVTYNALTTLSRVLKRIPPSVWRNVEEVVVFDDASQDATFELAVGIKAVRDIPKLKVIKHPKNLGYGGNQKAGYRYFIEKGFDVCVLLHGDGQYAPEFLVRMYRPLVNGEADGVFGSRMMRDFGGPLKGGMPIYKYVGNRILTTYENWALGMNLTEFHSGYRAYSLQALSHIDFSSMTDDFHFDTEIIIELHHHHFRIKEVPIPTFYGDEICYVNGMKYAADIYRTVSRYRRTIRSLERKPQSKGNHSHDFSKRSSPAVKEKDGCDGSIS